MEPTTQFLDLLNVYSYKGMDVRSAVLKLVENHLQPGFFGRQRDEIRDRAYRRLAREVRLDLLYTVAVADSLGRGIHGVLPGRRGDGSLFTSVCEDYFLERATRLKVSTAPPAPLLLTGKHLLEIGLKPGVTLGSIKQRVYERQLDGEITTLDEALEYGWRLASQVRHT